MNQLDLFPVVCAAIQYAKYAKLPVPPAWMRLRDKLYDALILEADLHFTLPGDVPWSALDPDEQDYARHSFQQLSEGAQVEAFNKEPTSITPWWSAFFFSS